MSVNPREVRLHYWFSHADQHMPAEQDGHDYQRGSDAAQFSPEPAVNNHQAAGTKGGKRKKSDKPSAAAKRAQKSAKEAKSAHKPLNTTTIELVTEVNPSHLLMTRSQSQSSGPEETMFCEGCGLNKKRKGRFMLPVCDSCKKRLSEFIKAPVQVDIDKCLYAKCGAGNRCKHCFIKICYKLLTKADPRNPSVADKISTLGRFIKTDHLCLSQAAPLLPRSPVNFSRIRSSQKRGSQNNSQPLGVAGFKTIPNGENNQSLMNINQITAAGDQRVNGTQGSIPLSLD